MEVLGLFHPVDLIVHAPGAAPERIRLADLTAERRFPPGSQVEIPQKIKRRFLGDLLITPSASELRVTAVLPRRVYLASVLAAETAPDAPAAALEAQAIVSRSYLLASPSRHPNGHFCDTTHCQWLREAPPPGHPAWAAVDRTRGLVLATAQGDPLPALFSRSCGGRTRPGLEGEDLRFRSVTCPVCRRLPTRWTLRLSEPEARALLAARESEAARLASGAPSLSFEAHPGPGGVTLEGAGEGHGVGLCQKGAQALARSGVTAAEILRVYFPHAAVDLF